MAQEDSHSDPVTEETRRIVRFVQGVEKAKPGAGLESLLVGLAREIATLRVELNELKEASP